MSMRKFFVLPAVLCIVSCSRAPKPAADKAPTMTMRVRSNPTKAIVSMSDPAIDDYIVKDVSDALEGNTWRWSYDRPELRFQLKQTAGQKVQVHFTVADATFKTTGPVTINFFVNNKAMGTMKISKPGEQVFSKAVPADLLKTDDLTTVAMEAKPYWTSATDGRHLTLILTQVGFVTDAAK